MQGVVNPAVVEEFAPEMAAAVATECVKVQPGGQHLLMLLSNGSVRFWNTVNKVLSSLYPFQPMYRTRVFRIRDEHSSPRAHALIVHPVSWNCTPDNFSDRMLDTNMYHPGINWRSHHSFKRSNLMLVESNQQHKCCVSPREHCTYALISDRFLDVLCVTCC